MILFARTSQGVGQRERTSFTHHHLLEYRTALLKTLVTTTGLQLLPYFSTNIHIEKRPNRSHSGFQRHISPWSIDPADSHTVTSCFTEFFHKEIPLTLHKSDFMPLISIYIPWTKRGKSMVLFWFLKTLTTLLWSKFTTPPVTPVQHQEPLKTF